MSIPNLQIINIVNVSSDPSSPNDGDIWYNTTAHQLMSRINGVSTALGISAGGNMDGGVSNSVYGGSISVDGGGA